MWLQRELSLTPKSRGFHLVTAELLEQIPELREIEIGLLHLLLIHTSASLSLNENADPAVRRDLERHSNELAPEDSPYYEHLDEGPDDMPAHIKSGLFGAELTLPLRSGAVVLGTWQGIYLGEHRDRGGIRRVIATLTGQGRA